MMRVVVLGTRGFPNVQGGVEKHCEYLYTHLVRLGCEVVVITRKPYVDSKRRNHRGVVLDALPTVRHKVVEAFLHTLLGVLFARKYRPDILHIHAIGPALFVPLARLLGMRVVLTTHGSNYRHLKWGKLARGVLKIGEHCGMRFSHQVIAVSEGIASEMRRLYGRAPCVIPNGARVRVPTSDTRELVRFGLQRGRYVLAVGRFVPEKGLHVLVEAFQKLANPGWKLVVAGQADHEDPYSIRLVEKARNDANIVLTGFVPEQRLCGLYSHAALFVLPSFYEGMCLALLEALSYGLPCLVSDIPGNRGLRLQTAEYFRAGDVAELAGKMQRFLSAPSLSAEGKKRQIDIVTRRFDWQTIARQTRQVYASALAPPRVANRSRKADRCTGKSALLCANFGTNKRMHHG